MRCFLATTSLAACPLQRHPQSQPSTLLQHDTNGSIPYRMRHDSSRPDPVHARQLSLITARLQRLRRPLPETPRFSRLFDELALAVLTPHDRSLDLSQFYPSSSSLSFSLSLSCAQAFSKRPAHRSQCISPRISLHLLPSLSSHYNDSHVTTS